MKVFINSFNRCNLDLELKLKIFNLFLFPTKKSDKKHLRLINYMT